MKKYQLNYSAGREQMYDLASREIRARRIVKVLINHYGKRELTKKVVLDVGSSTGILDNLLADFVKKIVGVDIDEEGISNAKRKYKKKNLLFKVDDAMNLSFKKNAFDIVICTQVYEHVPDSSKLFKEIYRVLKPGGTCYLAAINKFRIIEPHYNLPFLSWFPKSISDKYVSLLGKSDEYYESPKSYWGLKKLTNKFTLIDYTTKIVNDPEYYGYNSFMIIPPVVRKLILAPLLKYNSTTFIWLLVKN